MKGKDRKAGSIAKMIPVVIAAVVIGGSALAFAMIDDTNSVHIDAGKIEDSTLIVGSHLIYLGAMTDQIYEIAETSAEDSGQYQRYYKSELSGGAWYDVTEASSLADITTEGTVVQDSEIEALNMTHHTKSDGVTYDLRTGKAVCIFDINDPYDLENMKELEPIKLQYDTLAQTDDLSETNKRDMQIIEDVYKKDRETETTRAYDKSLEALQAYYETLVGNDAESSLSDMVMTVMEKIDNARRAEVLQPLNDGQLEKMNRVVSREYVYIEGEVTGEASERELYGKEAVAKAKEAARAARAEALAAGKSTEAAEEAAKAAEDAVYEAAEEAGRKTLERFTLNTDLVSAIGEAMSNVQESYISYSSNMLTEGTTVLSQVEYELSNQLISLVEAKNYAGCDEVVMDLIYLERVNSNVIQEENAEREFIKAELLGRAEDAYKAALFAGESEAYQTLSSMAAAAAKANVLKQQKNDTEIARNEFQFIMQAYIDRMPTETAMEYIAERIDKIGNLRSGIKTDAYEEYAQASVDAHLEWLQQTMKNLQDDAGNRTMDSLRAKKEALQTEYMTALDNNQLALAKKIQAQIDALDKEMEELEQKYNAILNSKNTSASEKAKAAALLGEGSASAALQEMKNNALEDLREGNLEGIENIIDGIGALAGTQPDSALAALQAIYEELSNQALQNGTTSATIKELTKKVEDVTREQMQNFIEDYSESDLWKLIEAFLKANGMGSDALLETDLLGTASLDSTMDSLSDMETAVILAGLSQYVEQSGSNTAGEVLLNYSRIAFAGGNKYIFEQLSSDKTTEYAPTDRIGKITGHRYIFNDSQKAVTLQKGSQYYKCKAFSTVIEKGETMEDMTRASGFQKVIYIPEDAAKSYFSLDTMYLTDTNYGVLLTEDMQKLALSFFDYLLEAGGES